MSEVNIGRTVDLGAVSAYAIAVEHGYRGTEAEWIAEWDIVRQEAQAAEEALGAGVYSVRYNAPQTLTDTQKVQARENIDGASSGDIDELETTISNTTKMLSVEETASGTSFVIDSLPVKSKISSSAYPVTVEHYGKNLIAQPFDYPQQTINGVTFTPLADGTVRVVGTATATAAYRLTVESDTTKRRPLKAGTYTLSGAPTNAGSGIANLWISGLGQGVLYDYGNGVTFTVSNDTTYYLKISVVSGQTVDMIFKPQIEFGSTKTEYAEYEHETINVAQSETEVELYAGRNTFYATNTITVPYYKKEVIIPETEIVNLRIVGAVGDGTTDDTSAIQQALNLAEGKILYIPEGTYLFSATLNIKSGTRIIGTGESSKFLLANTFSLTPYDWRTGDPLVEDQHRYPMIYLAPTTSGCVLENFALQGQSASFHDANVDGLCVRGTNHKLSNLVITKINYFPANFVGRTNNGVGYGIKLQDVTCITIQNCDVEECGYECIGTENADTVLITGCVCKKACQTTAQVHRSCSHIKIIGNTFDNTNYRGGGDNTQGPGFTLHASTDYPMSDILLDGNYIKSSLVFANGGGENDVKIVNNQMSGISLNAIDGYRNGCIVMGNKMMSQLNLKSDNAIIACNMIYHTGGGNMIVVNGTNVECFGNIPLNYSTRGIRIVDHDGNIATDATMTVKMNQAVT